MIRKGAAASSREAALAMAMLFRRESALKFP